MHLHVHNSIIYNCQGMEATWMYTIDEWIKMWYVDIWYIEDYPAIKKNEILPFAATGLGY